MVECTACARLFNFMYIPLHFYFFLLAECSSFIFIFICRPHVHFTIYIEHQHTHVNVISILSRRRKPFLVLLFSEWIIFFLLQLFCSIAAFSLLVFTFSILNGRMSSERHTWFSVISFLHFSLISHVEMNQRKCHAGGFRYLFGVDAEQTMCNWEENGRQMEHHEAARFNFCQCFKLNLHVKWSIGPE